jgi:hypothetical protein
MHIKNIFNNNTKKSDAYFNINVLKQCAFRRLFEIATAIITMRREANCFISRSSYV